MRVLALIPLLAGCQGFGPFHGIFMVRIPAPDQSVACTTEVVAHNFLDADVPQAEEPTEGPWTYEADGEFSDQIVFIEIIDSTDGGSVLVSGDEVYPGTREGGTYTYLWELFQDGSEREAHEEGYEFLTDGLQMQTDRIVMTRSGRTVDGTWTFESTASAIYTESDQWDAFQVGRYEGEIPSDQYLVDSQASAVDNDPDAIDCTASPCSLEVEETCTFTMSFTGTEVSLDDEAYENVRESGQPGGWNND